MMLPGLSEGYMSPRARLVISLGLSLSIIPIVINQMPPLPASAILLAIFVAKEIMVGLFIGTVIKTLFASLHTAGVIIAMESGLASAMLFDPSQGEQGSSIGVFLIFTGIMAVFAADIHHVFIKGIVDSYTLFNPAEFLPIGGFSELVMQTVAKGFEVAVRISSPVIVITLIVYLGGAIIGRLMPQMQVFFVLIPVQILLGFAMLMLAISTGLTWFLNYYSDTVSNFIK